MLHVILRGWPVQRCKADPTDLAGTWSEPSCGMVFEKNSRNEHFLNNFHLRHEQCQVGANLAAQEQLLQVGMPCLRRARTKAHKLAAAINVGLALVSRGPPPHGRQPTCIPILGPSCARRFPSRAEVQLGVRVGVQPSFLESCWHSHSEVQQG